MRLSKLWEIVKDREVWRAAVHGVTKTPRTIVAHVVQLLSCALLFVTPRTEVCQVPLSMEFFRQEAGADCRFLL